MSFSRPNHAPDSSGRGGFLLCNRDPTTVFQGEFNRLAAAARIAQNAHTREKLNISPEKLLRFTSSSGSPPSSTSTTSSPRSPQSHTKTTAALITPISSSSSSPPNKVTNYPKAAPRDPAKSKLIFGIRPLSSQAEERASWLHWNRNLDACTVFPLSQVTPKPSLNMKDYVEHEDPEDAGDRPSLSIRATITSDVRASPPISSPEEAATTTARQKQAQFAFGKKVSNLGQGHGRSGWAYAHSNNQVKDGLTHVGDTLVSLKHNTPDHRLEHAHAKDVGSMSALPPVVDQDPEKHTSEELERQAQFAFGKKVSNLGEGYGRSGWAFAHQNNQVKDGFTHIGDTLVSLKHNEPDHRPEHGHANDVDSFEKGGSPPSDCSTVGPSDD